VQRDPIKRFLKHVDLLLVKRGEKVTVEVPVVTEGELAPGGNLLEHVLNALPVEAEATHLPENVTVSVEGLEAGASIHAKDITLPNGVSLAVDADAVVLHVVGAQVEAAAEETEGEAGEESAEA
jgi:large subunit ribosomal protein L25